MARKILLADDSVTAQNMGRKILADAGYEVITVNNGSAALKKIAETKPDIIILDVYMPGYSGLEVCQRLKEVQETSRIPVLLTVGKLEPFKPEEAKRVRAEGYIVKPFEASELLSTLSKLEDKIVPRAEPSKPGRFARANAALDEGRYDKTTGAEEDSGWKNRIGFPSKNKKAAQDEGDDSAIYNAVNKDLRTVIDRKQATDAQEEKAQAAKAEEARFDLGALAPEGLPKDVTPEEIAALAAAAAQVKGKLDESAFAENLPELPPTALADAKAAEGPVAEAKSEEKIEARAEVPPVVEEPKESPAATFAAQKPEEPVEAATAKPFEAVKESVPVPSATEMMAAIAGLVPEAGNLADANSGNGFGSHPAPEHALGHHAPEHHAPADEPVTMAAAAGAGFSAAASRWTAVAVALAPDEAAISLEHEMQKAYAAFAAAEVAHAATTTPVPETQPAALEPPAAAQISSPVETPVAEALAPAVAAPEAAPSELAQSEVAQSMSAVAGAATEALSGAVKEFERVAASYVEPQPPVATPVPEEPTPAPAQVAEPVSESTPEALPAIEAKSEARLEETPFVEAPPVQPEEAKLETAGDAPEPAQAEQKQEPKEEAKQDEPRYEEPAPVAAAVVEDRSADSAEKSETAPTPANETSVNEAAANEASSEHISAHPVPSEPASSSEISAKPVSGYRSFANEAAADPISASPVASEIAPPTAPVQPAGEGTKDVAKKESDIAETTAAAWASWRRIRESGDAKAAPSQPAAPKAEVEAESAPAAQNEAEAAMAVAAGAEKSPEEIPAAPQESGEIASIVDSMLADMRPRIVEEVSRKLGKKK